MKHKINKILILIIILGFSAFLHLAADIHLHPGDCTQGAAGTIFSREFWKKSPAVLGTIIHNYIFDVWTDMGFLSIGAGVDDFIKKGVRPDFYFDGIIRDIKPLPKGKTPEQVVKQYKKQLKKYAETVYELNNGAYYPEIELLFYRVDQDDKKIIIYEKPYKVNLADLGINETGKKYSSLVNRFQDFFNNLGNLRGAIFDKKTNHLYFVGTEEEKTSGISAGDFVVAAHAIHNTAYQGAMVTFDPDPENLETRGIVKFGGGVEGTRIGDILFESDRLLKCLSQGYDNFTDKPFTSNVKGFKTMQTLMEESDETGKDNEWVRYWFTPEKLEYYEGSDYDILLFPKNMMIVKTENMKFDGKELKSDFTPSPSSPQGRFVDHFNKNIDEFANEIHIFRELQEIAKIFALLQWCKEKDIDTDYN